MSLPNHCKFFAATGSGVKLFVRLSPKAKREGVEGIYTDPDGSERLKIAVSAPPVDGKANEALIKTLAKQLKIAKSAISLIAGATDRAKTLLIEGDAETIIQKLEELS